MVIAAKCGDAGMPRFDAGVWFSNLSLKEMGKEGEQGGLSGKGLTEEE